MNIGLCLSGGGAKGAAHIGVIKALEEENIKICAISGTSSGSIVASLYACGYKANDIYYIFKKYCKCITDYNHMIPFKMLGTLFTGKVKLKSLAKGKNLEYIMDYFARQKGIIDISQCRIPLAIATVDIVDGQLVYYLSRPLKEIRIENTTKYKDNPEYIYGGILKDIVRASSSFPGIFEPKRINRHLLVDGGTKVNSPVAILKEIIPNSEKTMVVYFEKLDNNKIPLNIIQTTIKTIDIMSYGINSKEINLSDYILDIECKDVGLLDTDKIDYMVRLGYNYTKEYIRKNIK